MSANDLADRLDAQCRRYHDHDVGKGFVSLSDVTAAAALLREQAEQLDTLRNAIGDTDELLAWVREANSIMLRKRTVEIVNALAAAGGGVPEEGATDGQ